MVWWMKMFGLNDLFWWNRKFITHLKDLLENSSLQNLFQSILHRKTLKAKRKIERVFFVVVFAVKFLWSIRKKNKDQYFALSDVLWSNFNHKPLNKTQWLDGLIDYEILGIHCTCSLKNKINHIKFNISFLNARKSYIDKMVNSMKTMLQ